MKKKPLDIKIKNFLDELLSATSQSNLRPKIQKAIRMFKKQYDKISRSKFKTLRLLGTVGEPIDEHSWNWFYRAVRR